MNLKRILPSVVLSCLLTACVILCSTQSIQAQTYKKGIELNDSLVLTTFKKSFKHAGDKLIILEAFPDTVKQTKLLQLTLLNPDFSTFKTFSREMPIDKYIVYFHNGVDVIEMMEGDKPVYYWRYTTDFEDANGNYHNYTTVLNEASDSLFTFEVSFHGATVFDNGKNKKIVGESVVIDTIRYRVGDQDGWYTMQVLTSSIYDLKTGVNEFTFPRGTRFNKVAVVNDSARIYTQNDNMETFLTDYHPQGSESTCMKSLVYNMDYSVYKEMDYPFSSIGIDRDLIYGSNLYEPLYHAHGLYFLNSFYSYVKNDEGSVIDYSYRYMLLDQNGALVKLLDNPAHVPSSALWLPEKKETVFLNYNGVVLSCPELDSIGKYTDYVIKEDSSVIFAQVKSDSVRLLDERLNTIKSFPALPEEWTLSDMSQKTVVADSLLELVFRNYNNGIKVYNENGLLVVNEPDSAWKMDFMDYTPLFLMDKGHKYANLVDDSLGLWYRVAPLKAQAMRQQTIVPTTLQLYRTVNDSTCLVDSISGTGTYEGLLPEGTYYLRTYSDKLPSTYYPSALLWEDATPIAFTTDSLPVLTINQPDAPQALSPANEAALSGSLECDLPALLQSVDLSQVKVYVVESVNHAIIAIGTLNNMTFEMEDLPYGTYKVLIDIPGKQLLTTVSIVLSSGQKQGEVAFSLVNNGVSGRVITGLAKRTAENALTIAPNPTSDRIRLNAAYEGSPVELFDASGRKVLSTSIQQGEVSISHLPAGSYIVRIHSKSGLLRSIVIKK